MVLQVIMVTTKQDKSELFSSAPISILSRLNADDGVYWKSETGVIDVVTPMWAFDCITNYDFQAPSLYHDAKLAD